MGHIFLKIIAIVFSVIILGSFGNAQNYEVQGCDRTPQDTTAGKSRGENRFYIEIKGDPQTYSPGEMYTVSLVGAGNKTPAKFTWFSLSVETTLRSGGAPGALYLFGDSMTKFSEECPNTITASTNAAKTEVQALWTAPVPGTGCVIFRATVVETNDLWYQDDGPLSKILCESLQQTSDQQPEVNQICCACEEAKYEVTFEGLWSRQTHPKDFPDNATTRFSDVIGASHTAEYRFWDYQGKASEGLKQVAEFGNTKELEAELKKQSQHIRTIIKARGINYPNVTSKTFAVFRVDSKNHLISLVSMIVPSPDWIVGVSGLELCLTNCSWLDSKILNLYPYDAGTDSGITYISPDQETRPQDHIRKITTNFPADPRSPFYDPSGEAMKPLARLYLTRQRLYEKTCGVGNGETNSNEVAEACEVGEWSEWSDCSVTCGTGKRTRQRFYKDEGRSNAFNCDRELTSRSTCFINIPCRDGSRFEAGMEEDEDEEACGTTEWSNWSGCSTKCGRGTKTRNRKLMHARNWKKCSKKVNPPILEQNDLCEGTECTESDKVEAFRAQPVRAVYCKIGPWTDWSTCSASCGHGTKTRSRLVEPLPRAKENECDSVLTSETVTCFEIPSCTLNQDQAKQVCRLPMVVGPCRGSFERWYFDTDIGSCAVFAYSGCRGNRNRFESERDCEEACGFLKVHEEEGPFGGIKPASHIRSDLITAQSVGKVLHCRVSSWSPWSSCSSTCGEGYRSKSRRIIVNAKNGGRSCPRKLLKSQKCKLADCKPGQVVNDANFYEDEEDSTYECFYSEWTEWSPCSPPCGLNSVQRRARAIDYDKTVDPSSCSEHLETRVCNVTPCKKKDE